MDWLKTMLLATGATFVLALLAVILYVLVPNLLSLLTGAPSPCDSVGVANASYAGDRLVSTLDQLCTTTKSLLGVITMLLIILGGGIFALSGVVAIYEVLTSKFDTARKALWGALFIISFPIPPVMLWVLVYYFTDRKKIKAG